MEVVICEMGEAKCFLQIGTDTYSWYIAMSYHEKLMRTQNSQFFCLFVIIQMPGKWICILSHLSATQFWSWILILKPCRDRSYPQNTAAHLIYFNTCSNHIKLFQSLIQSIYETCLDETSTRNYILTHLYITGGGFYRPVWAILSNFRGVCCLFLFIQWGATGKRGPRSNKRRWLPIRFLLKKSDICDILAPRLLAVFLNALGRGLLPANMRKILIRIIQNRGKDPQLSYCNAKQLKY